MICGYLAARNRKEKPVATIASLNNLKPARLALPGFLRHPAKNGLSLLVLFMLVSGWGLRRPLFQGNLGEVEAGRVIRSAQPTSELPKRIQTYRLRSILNLRGGSSSDWWYDAEVKTCAESGVLFYDLPLSAIRRPTRRELLILIDTLKSCPYPLLIHCKSGSDRTGLAAAIYRMVQKGESPRQAEGAFSISFGHFPIGGTQHLHEPLGEYAAWLEDRGLAHTSDRFRDWVRTQYEPADKSGDPPPLLPGPRPHHHSWRAGVEG